MKKIFFLNLMLLLISWSLHSQTAIVPVGDGSSSNPYQIASLENLYWISVNPTEWDKNFIQTTDIDASATAGWPNGGWTPIGTMDKNYNEFPFKGTYDGKNHTISGLTINKPTSTDDLFNGMFGYVTGSTIQNLGLLDLNITAYYFAGGLGGRLSGCTVINCNTKGSITTSIIESGYCTGGLAAGIYNTSLLNCYSTCDVNGTSNIGGMVGYCELSTVINCHSSGNVTHSINNIGGDIGGFVGKCIGSSLSKNYSAGNVIATGGTSTGIYNGGFVGMAESFYFDPYQPNEITDCYSSGNVNGGYYTCGFVGYNYISLGSSMISNCYSRGVISGEGTLLPFAGTNNNDGSINNNFYDADVDGLAFTASGTIWYGATGKTNAEMKTQSTFTDWDFTSIWGLDATKNDGYPYLLPESLCAEGTLALTSGSENQTICAGTEITPIVYAIGGGATGATVSPELPTGLSKFYDTDAKTFTISGTPEVYGNFNYTVETTGSSPCTEATANGTIIVKVQPVATAPATGNGTSSDPYQIATLENLYWIRANPSSWTKYFIQTQDIDASATLDWCTGGWLPIGYYWENSLTEIKVFSGYYDGQGHTISGLHITKSTTVAYGLFGMTSGASIKNLGITNVEISGVSDCVGALVGYASGVSIYNCYSTGNISGLSYVGGLIGAFNTSSKMEKCYSSCNVNAVHNVGGLAGSNNTSEIQYCFTGNVTVTGSGYNIGGLVGTNISGALILKCYSAGTVSGTASVGGLVGMNTIDANIANCFSRANIISSTQNINNGGLVGWNDRANIINSYSTGAVGQYMGGLVGTNSGYVVSNSFWDKQTSGVDHSSGGTGKTTEEMKNQSTFTDWDFNTIWSLNAMYNDGYPYFVCTDASLALSSGSNTTVGCVNAAITPIVYYVGGGASGAFMSPALPNGLSGTYNSVGKTFTISGIPTVAGVYSYTITTTGTPFNCSEATATGTITINPLPEVRITGNNSPICKYENPEFYLVGTPDAEVVYSFDGGTTTWTIPLTGGTGRAIYTEASSEVTLSLISIKIPSTGCIKALTSTSTVTVINPPTVSISGAHNACGSTTLTAVTNASDPTYYWATLNEYDWVFEGEGPTLEVTRPEDYYLFVYDGITGCEQLSDPFTVTFIPEPEVRITGNNSPICKYENPEFYLVGTPDAEVVYSFDGGTTTWTVPLTGGTGKAIYTEASSDVTLSLISIIIPSTGCINALTSTSTVTVNSPPTASILGAHSDCGSTTLTAVTNASNPTYFWATADEMGWHLLGEGSTFEVTQSDNYFLAILDGITGCDVLSDAFEVTINPVPEVKLIPAIKEITEGDYVELTASGAESYSWSSVPAGFTSTNPTVTVSPVKNTTYTVTGTTYSCSATAFATIYVRETCKNSADQYEPNNSISGNLFTIPIDLIISANLLNAKDPDWYQLDISSLAKYTLTCQKTNTNPGSPSVDLYGSNGRKLKSIGRTEPNSYNLAAGTYYIKISAGVKTYLCYTLQVVKDGTAVGAIASFDDSKSAEIETIPDGICKIWPNPTNNEFKIYNGNEYPIQMIVIDVTGRQIEIIENVGIAETVVFGSKYKPGVYFVQTSENGVQKVFKVIKQ